MDESDIQIDPGPADEAPRDIGATVTRDQGLDIPARMRRAEKLLRQMATLQKTITRELAEISSEIGHNFCTEGTPSESSGDEEDDVEDEDHNLARATPEVAFVPWGLMTATIRGLTQYSAIEVSTNEPVGAFEPGTTWDRFSDPGSTTNRGGLLPDRIQINSPGLKALLRQIFGDPEVTLSAPAAKPLILLRPFKMLVCHKPSIKAFLDAAGESSDPETQNSIKELRVLASFIDSTLWPGKESLETVVDTANFSDLWYIFPPASLIYVQAPEFAHKVWCVVQRTGGRRYLKRPDHINTGAFKYQFSPFVIDCYYLDFDGRQLVPVHGRFDIHPYPGVRALSSLSVFPFRVALKTGLTDRETLISRGKEFMSYTNGFTHRYYDGRGCTRKPDGRKPFPEYEEKFDSEIIIDFGQALDQNPDWRPSTEEPTLYEMDRSELGDSTHNIDQDWIYDKYPSDQVLTQLQEALHSLNEQREYPDEEALLLLPDRVLGFALRNRKFASFRLGASPDGLRPLVPYVHEEAPWSKLYLPTGHRELIQTLVAQHAKDEAQPSASSQGLVRGRGGGLTLLLHGAPGTGKTLSAECAAASSKRPLFLMTSGDLGMTAQEVEANLDRNFHLAQAWGCVLLLDEADTFLAQREKKDLARNGLVSVFLRVLEYYTGILFLTTNRVGDFDQAFLSRIHVALYYPQLSRDAALTIWRNNIERVKEGADRRGSELLVDDKDIMRYAHDLFDDQRMEGRWNGREIRNAFQSALAMAEFGLEPGAITRLRSTHFQTISQSKSAFQKYRMAIHDPRPRNADLIPAPDKAAKARLKDPDASHERIPGGTDRHFNSSSDTGEDTDPDDRYPRLPRWERRPPAQTSTHPTRPGASSASRHQQLPSGIQQQPWPPAGMMHGGPMSFPPMMSYPNGVFGMQPFLQPQTMAQPGPGGMYPSTFSSSPWAPPQLIRVEPGQTAQGLRPGYSRQPVADPAQHSMLAPEPFDWLGETIQSQPSQFGTSGRPVPGYFPGYSPEYFHAAGGGEVGRERKRKRRGAGDGESSS